jgi:hypothetical protein
MAPVVQAKCPHCQEVLRIPADWLSKAMRCKHCKKTFQAKGKAAAASSTSVAAGIPAPSAKPSTSVSANTPPPKPSNNNSLGFDNTPATPQVSKRGKSGMGGILLLVVMFFILLVVGLGGTGYVGYKVWTHMAENPSPPKVIAKNGDAKTDSARTTDAAAVKDNTKPRDGGKGTKDSPVIVTDGSPPKKTDKAPPFVTPKTDKGTKGTKDGKRPAPFSNDPFPRRALLISVNNYLMFSTVHYGSARDSSYPGSSTGALRDLLSRPPMNFPVSQVTELSDGIPPGGKTAQAHSTQKSVIETTIRDFLESSRAQDRVMIVFAGHGASVEDKSYLVPIDGKVQEPESLVPLKWVYDQLASCKAQQKVLVLDTFRYSPSRGHELPSPGEGAEGTMPEAFDKDLQAPPAGVQVWCSCEKEQTSLELDRGSAFLQALCHSLQGGPEMTGFSTQTQPIPIEAMVAKTNQRLQELAKAEKRTQVSRLTGKASEAVVAFNKDEPLPAPLTLKPPTAPGGEAAGAAQVNNILDEIKLLPPWRDTRAGEVNLMKAQNLPAFSAKKLEPYKADDYQNISEVVKRYKSDTEAFAKQYPLRAAYFEVLEALQGSGKIQMREVLPSPVDPKRKAAFLEEQRPLGVSIFELEKTLDLVKKANEQREMETSKRWQANFDYAHARLQSRLIYLFEYNYTLGQIRADNLPELAPGQSGWRVGITGAKINVTEKKAKDFAKANKGIFERIQEQYPGTPWALLAQRESVISLGLAWRPKSD